MSDARLRELERQWRATGTVDDEAAYLLERVRGGELPPERLTLAAYCGHAAARRAAPCDEPPRDEETWLRGLADFGPQVFARAHLLAFDLASRTVRFHGFDLLDAVIVVAREAIDRGAAPSVDEVLDEGRSRSPTYRPGAARSIGEHYAEWATSLPRVALEARVLDDDREHFPQQAALAAERTGAAAFTRRVATPLAAWALRRS